MRRATSPRERGARPEGGTYRRNEDHGSRAKLFSSPPCNKIPPASSSPYATRSARRKTSVVVTPPTHRRGLETIWDVLVPTELTNEGNPNILEFEILPGDHNEDGSYYHACENPNVFDLEMRRHRDTRAPSVVADHVLTVEHSTPAEEMNEEITTRNSAGEEDDDDDSSVEFLGIALKKSDKGGYLVREAFCSNDEDEFLVDKLVQVRRSRDHELEFRVKWVGYSRETWEPYRNLSESLADEAKRLLQAQGMSLDSLEGGSVPTKRKTKSAPKRKGGAVGKQGKRQR